MTMNFRGAFGGTFETYNKGDVVTYDFATYVSVIDGNQNLPPAPKSGWLIIARFTL